MFPSCFSTSLMFDPEAIRPSLYLRALGDQTLEEQSHLRRFSAVEPENELVKVSLEMASGHPTLMSAQKPATHQRDDSAHLRQRTSRVIGFGKADPTVSIAMQDFIAGPVVGFNGCLRIYFLSYKSYHESIRRPCDIQQTNPAHLPVPRIHLDGDRHARASPPHASGRSVAGKPGIVHLDTPLKRFSFEPNHGLTELLKPSPGRLHAPQAKNTFQSGRRESRFLRTHPPHRSKPELKRLPRSMQHRASCQGRLTAARPAFNRMTDVRPSSVMAAGGAAKARGPPLIPQIGHACGLIRESPFEFRQIRGKIGQRRHHSDNHTRSLT